MTHKSTIGISSALIIIAVGVSSIIITASCHGTGHEETTDTLRTNMLRALDDSVAHMAPKARKMIENGMKTAADSLEYFEYNIRLARLFATEMKTDSAEKEIRRTINFLSNQPSTPRSEGLLAMAYNVAGVANHNLHHDSEKTKQYYNAAYRHIMQSNSKDMAPDICANLADAHIFDNNMPQAAAWYRRALFLVDSLQLEETKAINLHMGLGLVYMKLEDYDSALRNLKASERFFNEMRPEMQAYLVTTLGNFYYYTKQYDKSLNEFRRLERLLTANRMTGNFAWYACKLNLSDVLLNLNETKKAEDALRIAEPYFEMHGDKVATYYAHSIKLGIALRNGDMATASTIAALDDKPEYIEQDLTDIRNRYLRDYYEKTGDYRRAFYNLAAEKGRNDSLVHNRQHMIAAEIISRFAQDTLKLHHEIEIQHKEADMKKARFTIGGSVAALIFLVLAIICAVTYWHKKLLQEKMRIFKLKLENARNRISPHFVFNVLNNRITSTEATSEANELMLLAKLIRSNLDLSGRETVAIAEEIEFVDNYIAIEQRTIQGGIKYTKNIAPEITADKLNSFRIPSMCIQILVENSIKHALRGKKGEKRLNITLAASTNGISVIVSDNGSGFDIRHCHSQGQGLNILRTTISAINQRNKKKIIFAINNTSDSSGNTTGCEAKIIFPESVKEI